MTTLSADDMRRDLAASPAHLREKWMMDANGNWTRMLVYRDGNSEWSICPASINSDRERTSQK